MKSPGITGTGISVRIGKAIAEAKIPSSRFAGMAGPSPKPTNKSFRFLLEEALSNPWGGKSLAELADRKRNVLILLDDATRPTPTAEILDSVLPRLHSAGVGRDQIQVLFATGTHRAVSESEAQKKIGKERWKTLAWKSHDWKGPLVRMGWTSTGVPVDVNPALAEADLVIGIGSVFPHRYCGWSGGGKLVLPGASGEEAIAKTHLHPAVEPSITFGSRNNPAIAESREAARIAGLKFLVQVVSDGCGNVAAVEAGEPEKAHEAAIEHAIQILSAEVPISEIVVASAWPEDSDLWQAGKALYPAESVVKTGGVIILAASLEEGIGPHPEFPLFLKEKTEGPPVFAGKTNGTIALAAALMTKKVKEKAEILLVAEGPGAKLAGEVAKKAGFRFASSLQSALDDSLRRFPEGKIAVLKEAPLLLPVPKEGKA